MEENMSGCFFSEHSVQWSQLGGHGRGRAGMADAQRT